MEQAIIEKVNERIVAFLRQNTNLTIATCENNVPYCANCFYAYNERKNFLVFKSDNQTKHIRQAIGNNRVAGSITPDKIEATKIRGVQFQGFFSEPRNELLESLKKTYYLRYPFALAFPGSIWAIELTQIKMTDNTLGFGKKIEWKK